jgi:hypothetical protein
MKRSFPDFVALKKSIHRSTHLSYDERPGITRILHLLILLADRQRIIRFRSLTVLANG